MTRDLPLDNETVVIASSSEDQPTTAMSVVGPGRVLAARYELVSILGSGGMATVFRAQDRVLGREVAVKILRDQFASDETFLARFTREALDAARLTHPGLVTIFDAGVDRGTAYIVMELVHGRTVQEALHHEGPLPIARAVGIAADVCEVLDVAHRAGVVHRDIKPGNILLSDDGRTRVFDFGIARTDGSAGLTAIATVVGTAAYLSPEQAAGRPASPQSDLYAVGCVLDEMLTGAPPFTAESPLALLHAHVHDEPQPPSVRRPDVSASLDTAVLHLLAKDPARRPVGAAEARLELLATRGLPASATLLLPTVSPVAATRHRRSVTAIAVLAACFIVAVAVVALLLARPDAGSTSAAASPTASGSSAAPTMSATTPTQPTSPPIVVPVATTTAGAIEALRYVIATGQSAGSIGASAASQLTTATRDVASSLDRKKGKSAAPRVQALSSLVDTLAAGGQVSPAAMAPLQAAISQLQRLVDQAR